MVFVFVLWFSIRIQLPRLYSVASSMTRERIPHSLVATSETERLLSKMIQPLSHSYPCLYTWRETLPLPIYPAPLHTPKPHSHKKPINFRTPGPPLSLAPGVWSLAALATLPPLFARTCWSLSALCTSGGGSYAGIFSNCNSIGDLLTQDTGLLSSFWGNWYLKIHNYETTPIPKWPSDYLQLRNSFKPNVLVGFWQNVSSPRGSGTSLQTAGLWERDQTRRGFLDVLLGGN